MRYKLSNNAFSGFILISTLSIAFSSQIGDFKFSNKFVYSILAVWILIAFYKFIADGFNIKDTNFKSVLKIFFKYNFYPKLIIYIYTLVLIFLNITEKRFLSSNIQTFINAVSAIVIVYLYKNKAFKYSLIALIISYLYALIGSFFTHGVYFFDYLEFHDMAFGSGYIIIYFFLIKSKWEKKDVKYVFFVSLITIAAFKRIELAALFIVFLLYIFLSKFSFKKRKRIISVFSCIFILICYVYVYTILNEEIWIWFSKLGINVSGRNFYYQVAAYLSDFKVTFLGLGRNSMATIFTNEYSYLKVGNLHSDILRMYVECGFILFGIWLFIYLFKMPKSIYLNFGYKSMLCLFMCTLYTFIVYFTDNTELYLVNQYFYMLIPIHYTLSVNNYLQKP